MLKFSWTHTVSWEETQLILAKFGTELRKLDKQLGVEQKQRITRHSRNLDGNRRYPPYQNPWSRRSHYYRSYVAGRKAGNPSTINIKDSGSIATAKFQAESKLVGGKLTINMSVTDQTKTSPLRKKAGKSAVEKIIAIHTNKWPNTWPRSRWFFGFSSAGLDKKDRPSLKSIAMDTGNAFVEAARATVPRKVK